MLKSVLRLKKLVVCACVCDDSVMRQFDITAEDLPSKGQWIRLRQLSSWVRGGQFQGLYVHSSKWAPAEPNEVWLAAAADREEKRKVSMWAPRNQLGVSQSQSQSQVGEAAAVKGKLEVDRDRVVAAAVAWSLG